MKVIADLDEVESRILGSFAWRTISAGSNASVASL
jgi:hypothetical protein